MNKFRYSVSFRLFHPSISPEDVCKKLNMQAAHKWRAGEPRKTPKGTSLSGAYSESYCSFELDHPENVDLAEFLKQWNKKLLVYQFFLNEICTSGGRLEYFIGWYSNENSGGIFDLELLKGLVELKINLSIDFYGG